VAGAVEGVMVRLGPLLIVLSIVVAACGDGSEAASTADIRYRGTGTVLESPEHGPQLCTGVESSYPPQCAGFALVGWDWADVQGEESANGTTWGDFTVTGTWDGEALTLTEAPKAPTPGSDGSGADTGTDFATPCPAPDGGWVVVDPGTATQKALEAAIAYAEAQPDAGGAWIDQSINPAASEPTIDEEATNDPTRLVLNLTFTGDLAEHEADLREIWGGSLCVSKASAGASELADIRAEVEDEVGTFDSSSIDATTGRVDIAVPVDEGFQDRFDERYGPGVVRVTATLTPVGH